MPNLARFGAISRNIAMRKEAAGLPVQAGVVRAKVRQLVIIAWPGNAAHGHTGILEGEEKGKSLVRLTFSGAVLRIPTEKIKATAGQSLPIAAAPNESGKLVLLSISSETYEDSYKDGQLGSTGAGLPNTPIAKDFASTKEMLEYLAQNYGLSTDLNDYDTDTDGKLHTTKQVADHSEAQNGGWMEPTKEEVEAWKKGQGKLYDEEFYIKYSGSIEEGPENPADQDPTMGVVSNKVIKAGESAYHVHSGMGEGKGHSHPDGLRPHKHKTNDPEDYEAEFEEPASASLHNWKFGMHKDKTVEILKEGTLEKLMDAFPEAADKLANSGVDYAKDAQEPYVAYLPEDAQIPVLVPRSEIKETDGRTSFKAAGQGRGNHDTGAQRHNKRMDKIWEGAKQLEKERLAKGLPLNPNLTDPNSLPADHPSRIDWEKNEGAERKARAGNQTAATLTAAPAKGTPTGKDKASPPAEPARRGDAPQPEDLSKRAAADVKQLIEPPKVLESVKPKEVAIATARTAPEAPTAIAKLVQELVETESQKANIEKQIEAFSAKLNPDLVDEKVVKLLSKIHDAIKATGEPVLKLKDEFLAVDVKANVVEANMSEETKKKYTELLKGIGAAKATMVKLNGDLKQLVADSFTRMGGTESVQQRVTKFSGALIEYPGACKVAGGPSLRADQIQAGLMELFTALADKGRELISLIKGLVAPAKSFLESYKRDAAAAAKAQAA